MKLAAAILSRFSRRHSEGPDAFELRLLSMTDPRAFDPASSRICPSVFRGRAHA